MSYQKPVRGWRQMILVATYGETPSMSCHSARLTVQIHSQLIGLLFSALDASIVSTALVTISISLQNFLDAPWVLLSYLLAYLGCAVGFAKLSDIYGRREMVCCSWILFVGFSVGCARATTMTQL